MHLLLLAWRGLGRVGGRIGANSKRGGAEMKVGLFCLVLLLGLMSTPAKAETDMRQQCDNDWLAKSWSYNQFRQLTPRDKMGLINFWLAGFISGLSLSDVPCSRRISACADSTQPDQQLFMLEKKANDSPERWGENHVVSVFIWTSFVLPCFQGEIALK